MNYHIRVELSTNINKRNLKQLRNRSKWHTGGAQAGEFKAGKATVVKESPRIAIVKLNSSVNRKEARKLAKSIARAKHVKRMKFEVA